MKLEACPANHIQEVVWLVCWEFLLKNTHNRNMYRAANCERGKIGAENFRKVLMIGHAIGSARDRCWCKTCIYIRVESTPPMISGSKNKPARTTGLSWPCWPCHDNKLWMIKIDRASYIAENSPIMIHDIRWLRSRPRCTKIVAKSKSIGRSVGQSEIGAVGSPE